MLNQWQRSLSVTGMKNDLRTKQKADKKSKFVLYIYPWMIFYKE